MNKIVFLITLVISVSANAEAYKIIFKNNANPFPVSEEVAEQVEPPRTGVPSLNKVYTVSHSSQFSYHNGSYFKFTDNNTSTRLQTVNYDGYDADFAEIDFGELTEINQINLRGHSQLSFDYNEIVFYQYNASNEWIEIGRVATYPTGTLTLAETIVTDKILIKPSNPNNGSYLSITELTFQ